ncbi:MAG TPA: DUF2934 domain-containing protein [Nitrospira sp.]|nr:DUF2934 domain-containing protein [Nitrospira sp.]
MGQGRATQESTRGKGGKGKAIIKRSKEASPGRLEDTAESRSSAEQRPRDAGNQGAEPRDPQLTAKIQERAYRLYEAEGFQEGRALEHWLEAERQITGLSDRSD